MPDKPTIVFAHGLWADGSCYSKVIPLLLADGFQVISTQNHLNTVADDAAAVRTSFARASGPVDLVGHSYGGTVITAAGTDKRVAALVYICAFAPEDGDTTLVDQDNGHTYFPTYRGGGWAHMASSIRRSRICRRPVRRGAATRLGYANGTIG
jgi:pimeloyl-ACP methyl ester carboxylesterase